MTVSNSDLIFRAICGILLIMQTSARLWMTYKKPAQTGSHFSHKKREQFFIQLTGGAVLLAYLYAFLPDTRYFDFPVPVLLRWVGAGLMLTGNVLFITAYTALGNRWSPELEVQPEHPLIIRGIYQWIRHPMYTGFLIFGMGLILLSANFFGCAYLLTTAIMIYTRLPAEEEMLMAEFGEKYRKYQSHTSALFPGIF
jgi:protein-S-isoprenylcysteine O-methyltransferase Ste14